MQIIYFLLGVTAISSAIYYLFFKDNKNNSQNPYMGLRRQAILATPEQFQLQLSKNEETAFGVIAEFGMGGGSATIVSFITGDASMYTSRGGGIIGGGISHENVKSSAIDLVAVGQRFFSKMPKSSSLNTPKDGYIKFYILTNKATYSFEDKESEITNPNSNWTELFNAANEVITQLRVAGNM